MNNENLRSKNKRIFFISAVAIGLVVGIVFGMIVRIFAYEDNYVIGHAELNEALVKEVSGKITEVIQTELADGQKRVRAENKAVTEVLEPLVEGNQKYYIFASEDALLFYQNAQLTKNREGYTLERLLDQFGVNGGDGYQAFSVLLQTKGVGTIRFSVSENSGSFIGLAHTFAIEGKNYICIYCISESYILNIANARQENILMMVVFLLLGCIITSAIVFFVCCLTRLNRIIYENDLEIDRKNYIIDQFGKKVYHVGSSNEQRPLKNQETGIYTEDFLYNVVTELQLKQEKKMLVIVFGFSGKRGYRDYLSDVFKQIQTSLGQKELLFHLKREQLILLAASENDKKILEEIQLLNYILQEKYKETQLVINSVYAIQKEENLYKTLEQAIREYQKNFKTLR